MNIMPRISKPEDVGLDADRLANIPNYFSSYVDRGKLAGFSTLVSRGGEIAHFEVRGNCDRERGLPMEKDTIFRIYSMTKPITSLALMMLYEEGHFQLNHPVSRYIPEFKKLKVWAGGTPENYETKPCAREMTIRDLLTHTSGLTYGFMYAHPVDKLYRDAGIDGANTVKLTLKEMVTALADIPLLFSPGEQWSYSVSTDVCGYLVEVLSGRPLDEFLASRIFSPLGMDDTTFDFDAASRRDLAQSFTLDGVAEPLRRYTALGAASLFTSAHDMARFVAAQAPGAPDPDAVLSAETRAVMREPHAAQFGADIWGLGTMLYAPNGRGDFIIGHDGDNEPAINTAVRLDPATGDGIVVLETGGDLTATRLASEWVYWKTGKVDALLFVMQAGTMIIWMLAGSGLIILMAVVAGWRLRRRR